MQPVSRHRVPTQNPSPRSYASSSGDPAFEGLWRRRSAQPTPPAPPPPDETPPPEKPPVSRWRKGLRLIGHATFWSAIAIGLVTDSAYHFFNKDPVQVVQSVHRNTSALPAELTDTLKPFFDHAPTSIDFETLQVVPEFLPFFQQKNHVVPGFHGTVVLNPQTYRDYLHFDTLSRERKREITLIFAHELTHLVQMQLMGKEEFLSRISRESLQHDDVYDTTGLIYQQVAAETEAANRLDNKQVYIHPRLTLEQCAVMVERFIGHRIP
jgi:hypothetical protein